MPLHDHFHPPLSELRHWESFHARWATAIADALEADLLPDSYFAEVQIHVGGRIEVDVATMKEESTNERTPTNGDTAIVTAAPNVWSPPSPPMSFPAVFPDRMEILIFQPEGGPTLVAAIELVSPRNKDRTASRRAFATKIANYLQMGVGLVVIDVVTSRHGCLHNEFVQLADLDASLRLDNDAITSVSYRPKRDADGGVIDVWPHTLQVGADLPTVPLPLDKGQCVPLPLEEIYADACRRTRMPS